MRVEHHSEGFSVRAISGTRAVLLAMNAKQQILKGFLGFAVGRRTDQGTRWLHGFKCFREIESEPRQGQKFSTFNHPIQDFSWGHYWAEPETEYTYLIRPLFRPSNGNLAKLRPGPDLIVNIRTESETTGNHSVLFNRGAIVSQAYAEAFDDIPYRELSVLLNNPEHERTKWLSRGLLEGALAFISQASSARYSLHCSFYELSYPPILEALKVAAGNGVRVEVTYEAGHYKIRKDIRENTSTGDRNTEAIASYGSVSNLYFRERIHHISLTHNKFMVLCEDGHPIHVWTGSTNITQSGFLGQSNTGHIVRDPMIAQAFYEYFQILARDERRQKLKDFCMSHSPNPYEELSNGTTLLFSPRRNSSMLDWYGRRMDSATETIFLTSAFGVTPKLANYFDNERDYLRYVLMEQRSRGKGAQEKVERDPNTRVVFGQGLGTGGSRGNWKHLPGWNLQDWLRREVHYRSSGNVFFVHTKYMGIDVLSSDPLVFTGSGNFSPNALINNDENMLLIRGNTKVADIYTVEFFRLLNHFYFRQVANRLSNTGQSDPNIRFLDSTDLWVRRHFEQRHYRSKRRQLLGIPPV
jgi:phosphatidylserine/phosphatidylglycerophosphate/cardiolipin synthase-like enzyme